MSTLFLHIFDNVTKLCLLFALKYAKIKIVKNAYEVNIPNEKNNYTRNS